MKKLTYTGRVFAIAIALCWMASPSRANVITPSSGGALNLAVTFSSFAPGQTTVSASGTVLQIAGIGDVLLDTLGGGPGTMTAMVVNQPVVSQVIQLSFVLGGLAPDLTAALLTATGSPLTPPITDPALVALLSPSSFSFALNSNSLGGFDANTGNGTLVYDFVAGQAAGSVPEPGSLALMLGGVLVLAGRLR
ncbi:MAG: hypothetical protein JST11_30525, partial [Acidobacteria bacterium]|nr:hypothetical protein [Acidobacteriota bacterium]